MSSSGAAVGLSGANADSTGVMRSASFVGEGSGKGMSVCVDAQAELRINPSNVRLRIVRKKVNGMGEPPVQVCGVDQDSENRSKPRLVQIGSLSTITQA